MINKKYLLCVGLLVSLTVTACNNNEDPVSSSLSGSSTTTTSSSTTTTTSISTSIIENYDSWVDSWSEQGHVYFHYYREDANYDNYALWLWQNAPTDSEGTLWGASNADVQALYYAMTTSWMTNIGGSGQDVDQSGRIMDVDLYADNLVGGRSGNTVSFEGMTRLGFLIVDQSTMDGGTHWTTDGGSNTYISNFDELLAEKGYLHIYIIQGDVKNYTFAYSGEATVNPIVTDTTGSYRSSTDVDSSSSSYGISPTASDFSSLGVGYQIFVASFRDSDGDGLGDIRGIINSLDYLEDLGVEVLWLTPIQESESYHGYDVTDFYNVDSKFGTLEDYRELIYKAHQKGMKVIMDLVLNHTSKNNTWFLKSQAGEVGYNEFGEEINYRDMYHWKYEGDQVQYYDNGTYTYINVEDHPDWYKDGESNYYYYGKFGSSMAELNYDSQATRDLVINMALYWLGFGLDGFRLDAVKHIYMKDEVDDTGSDIIVYDTGERTYYDDEMMMYVTADYDYSSDLTKNVNFWKEFANRLKAIYPECFLVGENFDGYGARIAPYYQALDSQFDFSLYYHNYEWLYGRNANTVSKAHSAETYDIYKSSASNYIDGVGNVPGGSRSDFINGAFTSNHDVARAINHMSGDTDKITGTTAQIQRAKVGAASTILTPGISWIYYGDELGMSGNTDQHETLYGNENNLDMWYRQPFKWGDDTETSYSFNGYQVEYDSYNETLKSAADQASSSTDGDMLDFYKELTAIKKLYGANATYVGQDFNSCVDVYHFTVESDNGTFAIYINVGTNNVAASVDTSSGTVYALNGATSAGAIPPYGVLVIAY